MITDDDRSLWLRGAIEKLCRAQTEMADTEASAKLGEAVHLIAEVGHGINPRSDTFRRNLRRPDEPCDAEIWSWDLFTPRQVDAYWIGCDRVGPHDEHHDNHTGAVWSDDRSATVPERTNR